MGSRPSESIALTEAQKRQFVRNGFVVIEDAIDNDVLERVQESFWDSLPDEVDRTDPETWDETRYEDGLDQRPEPADRQAHEDLLREVYPYAEDLVGPPLAPPEKPPHQHAVHAKHNVDLPEHEGLMAPYPNYPGEDTYPDDLNPHLDGGGNHHYTPFNVVMCVYVSDVRPGDGGYTAWPGSHRVMGDHFEGHNDLEYYYETIETDDRTDLAEEFELGPPMEFTGTAGTAFISHPALVHSPGPNLSDRIRQLCLCRLAREDVEYDDIEAVCNLWDPFEGFDAEKYR